jgi:hypothetical protein
MNGPFVAVSPAGTAHLEVPELIGGASGLGWVAVKARVGDQARLHQHAEHQVPGRGVPVTAGSLLPLGRDQHGYRAR